MTDTSFLTCEIKNIEDFMNEIIKFGNNYPDLLYRGISKACDGGGNVTSSAYRKYMAQNKHKPSLVDIRQYHYDLLEDIKRLNDKDLRNLTDMQYLAHIQHTVGGTLLVDYSKNPLVSLWFAVGSDSDSDNEIAQDGFVYVLNNTDYMPVISQVGTIDDHLTLDELFEKDPSYIYKWMPGKINQRIIAQQGVFVVSLLGEIAEEEHIKIYRINKDAKKQILKELSLLGISRKILFPDFSGTVMSFSYKKNQNDEEINDLLYKANNLYINYKMTHIRTILDNSLHLLLRAEKIVSEQISSGADDSQINIWKRCLIYDRLGSAFSHRDDCEAAINYYQKALETEGINTFLKARIQENIGLQYIKNENYSAALTSLSEAEAYCSSHPAIFADILNDLGLLFNIQEEYDKATEKYEKALSIRKQTLGLAHQDTIYSYANLAFMEFSRNRYSEAAKLFENAIRIESSAQCKIDAEYIIKNELKLPIEDFCDYEKGILNLYYVLCRRKYLGLDKNLNIWNVYEKIGDKITEKDKSHYWLNRSLASHCCAGEN